MFKPFAMFCPTCNFVFKMKRRGQFTECPCGNAVDAGNGFTMRTIGEPRRFLTNARMLIELYREECASTALWVEEGIENGQERDGHTRLQTLIRYYNPSITRAEAKNIMYGYLYSENSPFNNKGNK